MSRGNHFLLPGEDTWSLSLSTSPSVTASRNGNSRCQPLRRTLRSFGSHATSRAATVVGLFDGKYHGHGDATLVVVEAAASFPSTRVCRGSITGQARVVRFNGITGLEGRAPLRGRRASPDPACRRQMPGSSSQDSGFHEGPAPDDPVRLGRCSGWTRRTPRRAAYGGMSGELRLSARPVHRAQVDHRRCSVGRVRDDRGGR